MMGGGGGGENNELKKILLFLIGCTASVYQWYQDREV